MLTSLFLLLADAQGQPAAPDAPASPLESLVKSPVLLIIPLVAFFYFIIWRPMKRQEADRQAMLSKMKKNDEILTTGGMYATIIEVSDKEDKIIIKIADNVRVKISKTAIARNITNEEDAAKAKEPAAKEGAA